MTSAAKFPNEIVIQIEIGKPAIFIPLNNNFPMGTMDCVSRQWPEHWE
jgi:hypothetical protein